MKGWELYSWKSEACYGAPQAHSEIRSGNCYALLPGTNRNKAVEEITSAKLTLPELKKKLAGLKKGEEIFWTSRLDAADFFLPPDPLVSTRSADANTAPVLDEGKRLGLKITVTPPPNVGTATMAADGTIALHLRSLPPGPIAEGLVSYAPSDPKYQETLKHLGGLKPGETKLVAPFPEEPAKK